MMSAEGMQSGNAESDEENNVEMGDNIEEPTASSSGEHYTAEELERAWGSDPDYVRSITHLSLSEVVSSTLPQCFSQLTQLQVINLSGNDFSAGVPAVIGEMNSLSELNLTGCKISDLPESFCQLTRLQVINLSGNDFSAGVPAVVGEMSSLSELNLTGCKISDLPERFDNLCHLVELRIVGNHFTLLPPVVYELPSLERLNLSYSNDLETIDEGVLALESLSELDCRGCESLKSPPYSVCKQGMEAVKKYFTDLKDARGVELAVVPIAVIGQTYSGKTSIVRSLQSGERKLTYRKEKSLVDEATKVFEVKDLPLPDSHAKLIDYGDDTIYHIMYCVINKKRYVPLVVVNMEEFARVAREEGVECATRKVCFNWLAHLYVGCPDLGPPLLALTHTDKLPGSELKTWRQELLGMSEEIRGKILEEEKAAPKLWEGKFSRISHLSNQEIPVFSADDIVEFSNDKSVTSNIDSLKDKLNRRCKEFNVLIPRLWENVNEFIQKQVDEPFVALADIQSAFPGNDCHIILQYMHNTGSILWFQQFPLLKDFAFHRIPVVTNMISILFHHCSEELWQQRFTSFKRFSHGQRLITSNKYRELIGAFKKTGEMDQALLYHLLHTESEFPLDVAVELLRCFHIIHGPIIRDSHSCFIIPCLSTTDMGDSWKTAGTLQLRLNVDLGGLVFPRYAHHLITTIFLNRTVSTFSQTKVNRDGASVQNGGITTHLIHDFDEGEMTLQVSTDVQSLGSAWRCLLETTKYILEHISDTWKACLLSICIFCPHCLFLRDPNPYCRVIPAWLCPKFTSDGRIIVETKTCSESLHLVVCERHVELNKEEKATVPSPLMVPYDKLSDKDIAHLENYLSQLESQRVPEQDDESATSSVIQQSQLEDGGGSELSDVGEYFTPSAEGVLDMRLIPVRKRSIMELYEQHDKVYKMSDGVRGRALIINVCSVKKGDTYSARVGSHVDYENVSNLFDCLGFDIVKRGKLPAHLTAQQIYGEIIEESKKEVHHQNGMFVLVLMSMGTRGEFIWDSYNNLVDLVKVKDLLSPAHFAAMKGKPKLLIVQACSGDRFDYGDTRSLAEPPSLPDVSTSTPLTSTSAVATAMSAPPTTLNVDDFLVMKASSESYIATRSEVHGSWFIRMLAITFYQYAHSNDVESLCKIVQERVRKLSITHDSINSEQYQGGNVPISYSTFTKGRKLHLFPGYRCNRK